MLVVRVARRVPKYSGLEANLSRAMNDVNHRRGIGASPGAKELHCATKCDRI